MLFTYKRTQNKLFWENIYSRFDIIIRRKRTEITCFNFFQLSRRLILLWCLEAQFFLIFFFQLSLCIKSKFVVNLVFYKIFKLLTQKKNNRFKSDRFYFCFFNTKKVSFSSMKQLHRRELNELSFCANKFKTDMIFVRNKN
jgi:hypothetical protein